MFFDIFDLPQCFSSYFHCWSVFLVTKMYKKRCNLRFQYAVTLFCISHQPSFSRTSGHKFLKNRSSEDVKFYVDSGEKIIGRLPAIILTQIENASCSRIGNQYFLWDMKVWQRLNTILCNRGRITSCQRRVTKRKKALS